MNAKPMPTLSPQDSSTAIEAIHAEIIALERAIHDANRRLNAAILALPPTFAKKYRLCRICQLWTLERFSAKAHTGCTCCTPQCTKHTAKRDEVAKRILAELIYGNE